MEVGHEGSIPNATARHFDSAYLQPLPVDPDVDLTPQTTFWAAQLPRGT
ncbi:hypothetical protein [uncultured Sulfitobacter sp.]|nr:hypothetical protein [uncultured Sulfitobacter sp.]